MMEEPQGPHVNAERDAQGRTTRITMDAEVAGLVEGEGVEQQAVLLFRREEGGLPVNLVEILDEHFGPQPDPERRYYGALRVTIERIS